MSGKLRFKVQLPKKAAKMKKHLLISNPDHASGMPGTSKGGVGVSTSKAKPVVKPRNKRVPKNKMTFANDEDEDEDEEDSYDGNVSESDLPPKKKQKCMVERERSHRSRPTPKYGKVSKNGEAETVRKYASFEDNEAFLAWLDESASIGVKKEDDQVLATVPKYTHDLGNNETFMDASEALIANSVGGGDLPTSSAVVDDASETPIANSIGGGDLPTSPVDDADV